MNKEVDLLPKHTWTNLITFCCVFACQGGFTDDLDEFQMESLEDWVNRLSEKYAVVGRLMSLDIAASGGQAQRTFTVR